jgi:hypothetical protein
MLPPFAARRALMRKALWSKHSWIRTACLTICLLAAGPAGAQSPSPEAMAAARELIVTMRAADYFKTLMPAIMQQLKPAIVQNRPQVERDYDAIVPLLLDSMNARVNEIIDQIAALYARNFSIEGADSTAAAIVSNTPARLLMTS